MRNILPIILVLPLLIFSRNTAKAQTDPHFSQYYVYPAWLNPALTGAFDGNYRVAAIYRSQWGNISDPFTTYGVAADFTTNKQFNFGVSALNQKAGDGGYNYTTAYGSASYTGVRFGAAETHRLVFGLQFGLIQRKFDASKLSFGDQWNPITGYNPGTPSADGFSRTNATSFDAGAGVLYYDAAPGKKYNIFGGFSVAHLTRPTDQFSPNGDARFPMRITGHAGVKLAVTDVISVTPNILYLRQGNAEEKMIGAYGQLYVNPITDFLLGVNYRFKDAVSTHAGFTYKSFTLGASYDINTSQLGKMARGSNSFELSLTFIGRKIFKAQDVEFVCPRL
jgi:type IX secretion system PorP/SprF family membrane protein